MYEELIPALVTATRIACLRLASAELADAAADPTATAHPAAGAKAEAADEEIFGLLAESVPDPAVAGVLRLGPRLVRDLALAAGPHADGIIANANRRLLAHLRAADADAAEREMERFLRCLHVMWRLAGHSPRHQPARHGRTP